MFPYGAVYRVGREDTPDRIRCTLEDIRGCGMNLVVVWPSVYHWEAPDLPGRPYATGRFLLDEAARLGLGIVMETAGQIASLDFLPDGVMKDEYLAVTRDGLRTRDNGHYYYGYPNYFHPEVRALMRRHLEGIAGAYRDHPALHGYDIWNETMFESYDEWTFAAFRDWLRAKYGTLRALNDAWDRTFTAWEQARPSQLLWASAMPFVDWKQFHKDSIGLLLRDWASAVRAVDPGHPVLADNIHSAPTADGHYGERAQDDRVVAAAVDAMGISFYPKNGRTAMPAHQRALTFDAVRAANGGRGFWLAEMQTHHQTLFSPFGAVPPAELERWCLEAVAHGAKAIVHWKWDVFRRGLQVGGRGLVDATGGRTPRADAAERIGRLLEAHPLVGESEPVPARAALLYDRLCHDFTKALTLPYAPAIPDTLYTDALDGLAHALHESGVPVDVVFPEDVLSGRTDAYPVLFATGLVAASDALADALLRYVERGGTLVADGKFCEIDPLGNLREHVPGRFGERLGYRVLDADPDLPGAAMDWDGWTCAFDGWFERKRVALGSGPSAPRVVGRFDDGAPAALASAVGEGTFLHLLTFVWAGPRGAPVAAARRSLAAPLVERLDDLRSLALADVSDPRVAVALKRCGEERCLFLWNLGDGEAEPVVRLRERAAGGWRFERLFGDGAPSAAEDFGEGARLRFPTGGAAVYRVIAIRTDEGGSTHGP